MRTALRAGLFPIRQGAALGRWAAPGSSRHAPPSEEAEITWAVHLANKKAAWHQFRGRADHPGDACSSGCVDVRGYISEALRLEACGVVCISVSHRKSACASASVYKSNRKAPAVTGALSRLPLPSHRRGDSKPSFW